MLAKLQEIEKRFESVEADYNDPRVVSNPKELQRLGKLRSELEPIVLTTRDYKKVLDDLSQAEEMMGDPELKELAVEELGPLREKRDAFENQLKMMLVPKDPNNDKPVIVEIRPAAGGAEAALFANELFRMYTRWAERRRWKVEVMDHEESGIGGLDRVVFKFDAPGAFGLLKFESGVHRVPQPQLRYCQKPKKSISTLTLRTWKFRHSAPALQVGNTCRKTRPRSGSFTNRPVW